MRPTLAGLLLLPTLDGGHCLGLLACRALCGPFGKKSSRAS